LHGGPHYPQVPRWHELQRVHASHICWPGPEAELESRHGLCWRLAVHSRHAGQPLSLNRPARKPSDSRPLTAVARLCLRANSARRRHLTMLRCAGGKWRCNLRVLVCVGLPAHIAGAPFRAQRSCMWRATIRIDGTRLREPSAAVHARENPCGASAAPPRRGVSVLGQRHHPPEAGPVGDYQHRQRSAGDELLAHISASLLAGAQPCARPLRAAQRGSTGLRLVDST